MHTSPLTVARREPAPLIATDVDAAALFAQAEERFRDTLEIRRLVAASATRALFIGRDIVLNRTVALRVHYAPDTPGRRWFERETALMASLDHSALRPVYSAGFKDAWAFRIAKWIDGESLDDAVARAPRAIPNVIRLARELASLLEYVHSHHITIRHIVPGTVMIETTGRIYMIDLRYASACLDVAGAWDEESIPFLAPEIRKRRAGTPMSDIYTAGAILFFAVTGTEPPADPAAIPSPKQLREACPRVLERVILRALAAKPSARYLTAAELNDDLSSEAGDLARHFPVAPPLSTAKGGSPEWEQQLRRALGDDYELLGELGAGGYGRVYLVRDLSLEREVALKILHPHLTADPAVVERFQREARLAAQVTHPYIVNTYDIGGRTGLLWYTMEYVPGGNLAWTVERDGPLSVERLARLMFEALEALAHAHARGLVHRDIKPENILIDATTGHAVITDFGLALAFAASEPFGGATSQSGTPEFAAPEQLLGEQVDHRVDLYSLTLCAYFALLGEPPFTGDTVTAVLARQTTSPLPNLHAVRRDVPAEFQRVLQKGAARRAEQRYDSAEEYSRALKDSLRRGLATLFRWTR